MKSLPGIFAIALTLALTACSEEQAEAPAAPPAKTETALPAAGPDPTPTLTEDTRTANDGAGARAEPFFAQMVLGDVTFQVESPNDGSINQVTVRAEGPDGTIGQMEAEADGTITNAEVKDLNADGYPEIYVYVTSAGSGSYGSLIAYASNRNKSLSQIYLPSIEDDPAISKGYMGHDEFAVGEGTLLRRFPIYKDGDTNAQPTGGTRQIQYKLEAGEAGWLLRQDRVVEF